MTAEGSAAARAARVVWAALALSATTATVILVALRTTGSVPVPEVILPPTPLRVVSVVLFLGATVALRVVRATFAEVRSDRDDWWTAHLGKAVAVWALADGMAILGAVAYLLTGDTLVLALAVGWAAAMFVGYAPGRLTNG